MAQHIFTGTAAPTIIPTAVGQHFIDTVNKVSYISVGTTSSADWETSDAAGDMAAHLAAVDPHSQYLTASEGNAAYDAIGAAATAQANAVQRANHTGTQLASTISDFDAAADARVAAGITGKQDTISASNNQLIYSNNSSIKEGLPGFFRDTTSGGINASLTEQPNNASGNFPVNSINVDINPIANSPNEQWTIDQIQINLDTANDGFSVGTSGTSVKVHSSNIVNTNTSDIGAIDFITNSFNVGNGIDPIDMRGFSYAFGFGQVNANVNINGPMQGYGFQPNINAAATIDSAQYVNAFYDNTNTNCASPSHTSFNAAPNIEEITNNHYYNGIYINGNINSFTGNAGYSGVNIAPNIGPMDTGGFNGVYVNPTIDETKSAFGLFVSMDNVTTYAGTNASLVIQDLTITADLPSAAGNTVSIEYTSGGTAGAEVVSNTGLAFTVQIDSGVSTATQVAAALNAYVFFTSNLNVTISGTASNPQVAQAATNLSGGTDPGYKKAAYLDGDVEITGNLTFGGALSIGKLSAYDTEELVDSGGTPATIHGLVTQPTVAANATLTSADAIGVNTAMLLTIGDNATVGTSFIGLAALGLPAVINMGTGSTIDQVSGATFALSLDATATGGTIDNLDLCRSIAIPNGATTVTKLSGYKFDLPFGDPGTTSWGFYESPGVNNYMQGNLLIGGTAGSVDTVTNSSVALEINSTTKAFLNARMTTTERNALTAINGMQIYNTTTDKLQVYAAGSWVDLH